ncbi:MAG: M3 family metallopeptidase [Candidatus Solibacter sp.]
MSVFRFAVVPTLVICAAGAQEMPKSQPPVWAAKPDIAAFEKAGAAHLAEAQRHLERMLAVTGARTIENTLRPFDAALERINAANYFGQLMQQLHPDAKFRDAATEMTRKASAAATAVSLNREVYQALTALDLSKTDAATRHYVSRQLLQFRLAGVDKDEATRTKLKQLNDRLVEQQSAFDRNIADDRKVVKVANAGMLAGLPQDYIDRHKPAADGSLQITTDYPDILPAMKFVKSDPLRRELYLAFQTRAFPQNRDMLKKMMRTRYEIASMLGYASWADYFAADKMVGSGKRIAEFIQEVDTAARALADREFAMLLAEKKRTDAKVTAVGDYEVGHLSEMLRRSKYDFDSQSVRPYFPYAKVKQGILDTAATLFGLTFKREEGVPAWDPSVETWIALDKGKPIGRFYLDMHPRAGKFSHAAMSPVLDGVKGRQLPEAVLMCNFPQPSGSDPGLMEFSDVGTFFHEFGHLMHWILGGHQEWAGVSGITMESDFVEAPSQMLEEWLRSPQVLVTFARHFKTGEVMPPELIARMNRASAFGRGSWVSQQNTYTAISYDVYKGKPEDVDLDAMTQANLKRYSHTVPTPTAHMYASFGHLGGYSSAYYTYLWDKVIAEDFFQQFDPSNLLGGAAAMKYRKTVLEPGGSQPANDLVKNFLGRPQNMQAFQKWMAEEFADGKN